MSLEFAVLTDTDHTFAAFAMNVCCIESHGDLVPRHFR